MFWVDLLFAALSFLITGLLEIPLTLISQSILGG